MLIVKIKNHSGILLNLTIHNLPCFNKRTCIHSDQYHFIKQEDEYTFRPIPFYQTRLREQLNEYRMNFDRRNE